MLASFMLGWPALAIASTAEWLLAGTILTLCVGGIHTWHSCVRRATARRFADREVLSPDEWFERYLPVDPAKRDSLKILLRALGEDLAIDWTRLRPNDTFSTTLRGPRWAGAQDFGALEAWLETWINKHVPRPNFDLPDAWPDHLGDWLRMLLQVATRWP